MEKSDIIRVLKMCPSTAHVEYLLSICNLSDKDRHLIKHRIFEGKSQEEYAEMIDRSDRYVRESEAEIFRKISKNLDFLHIKPPV